MRIIKTFAKYTITVVTISAFAGCYDSFDGADKSDITPSLDLAPNVTIQRLHEILTSERLDIYSDLVVMGTITANDKSGNIYNSFYMEADGYAIEVLEGLYDSYVHRVEGYKTLVKLKGLSIARQDGVLRVGLRAPEGSYYALDYLRAQVLIDRHITNSYMIEDVTPSKYHIHDLEDNMCGRLISIEGLTHVPSTDATQPYTWSGYQCFVDSKGSKIWSKTSTYANFAESEIPYQRVALCGILQKSHITSVNGDQYIIVMRDVEDCTIE